jgi:Protein of unknown function (DUF3631)
MKLPEHVVSAEPRAHLALDAVAVLEAVEMFVRRFVALKDAEAVAVTLFVAHSHAIAAAHATPYLAISSAEKESGKTRLLEVLEPLVACPWMTGRTTAAALVRKLAADTPPTLLLDESDAAFNGDREYSEALRGVLNSGHRRGGCATLCVGQGAKIEVRDFPVFGAKAVAGIGKLPDTVASRAIAIRLKRKAPGEPVERFRRRYVDAEAVALHDALAAWTAANIDKLTKAEPALPDELTDRQQDGWEPLLALADLAGGEWPVRARGAAVRLAGSVAAEDDSTGVRLLADVRVVFGKQERMATADLLAGLHDLDEAPWGEWYGKPITSRGLAKLLHRFEIRSKSTRMADGSTPKGFHRDQFEDAWKRYLPGDGGSIRHNATSPVDAGQTALFDPPQQALVADAEPPAIPDKHGDVAGVADRNPVTGNGLPAEHEPSWAGLGA